MWEGQIVAARSDSPSVRRYDDEHLRRFLLAREAGDAAGMRRWWEELVIDFRDRMDGLVRPTTRAGWTSSSTRTRSSGR